jgi:Flp pilus assembly protein TadG
MLDRSHSRGRQPRRGAAVVELALLLPFLIFLFLVAVDYCRLFYYSQTLASCARNGALYGSDPVAAAQSPYPDLTSAALADASNLTPSPSVSSTNGTDSSGNPYVEVTVSWTFQTITNYPGIPSTVNLQRKVRMRVAPTAPN